MTYVTDAAREYAKKMAKDSEDIVESFIHMIDAFDELHHDELVKLFKQQDVDEFTGPTIGSKLLERYAELLK